VSREMGEVGGHVLVVVIGIPGMDGVDRDRDAGAVAGAGVGAAEGSETALWPEVWGVWVDILSLPSRGWVV